MVVTSTHASSDVAAPPRDLSKGGVLPYLVSSTSCSATQIDPFNIGLIMLRLNTTLQLDKKKSNYLNVNILYI
jgi:hypothetical protein